jgi:hypothetical protein
LARSSAISRASSASMLVTLTSVTQVLLVRDGRYAHLLWSHL